MADWVMPDDWTPAGWPPAAVMDMQARLDPARMTRHADDWHAAVDEIGDVFTELHRRIAARLDEAWRGHGADSALTAVQQYVSGSLDGLAACRSAAVHLTELSRAAGDLRACLSTPVTDDEALMQVRRLYSAPAVAAGNAVADIPAPPDQLPTGGSAVASVLPAGMPTTQGAMTPSAAPQGSTPTQSTDSAWRPAFSSADTQPPWRAPTSSAAVRPPDHQPLPSRVDPPVASSSPPPSGMPAAAESPRTPGRTNPSSSFAPFLGAPYAGLPGRGDSTEHRPPRYLISAGNASELVGELPLVAPPVIGE